MLVRLNGYNQWPDHFPPSIPCSIRWPQLMSSVAGWPYQWVIYRTHDGSGWPTGKPHTMVATFVHPISPVWRWVIVPSPLGPFSHVELQFIVHNEGGELSGVTRRLKVVTQPTDKYDGETMYTNLSWPEDQNYQWQNRRIQLEILDPENPITDYAAYDIMPPAKCGVDIDVG